ncbi:MAG TPA: homoserine O-acetyltransferase [Clostridia bacterium]|nr:homoserine O-acetyltransferase [Clostridia bacterium]
MKNVNKKSDSKSKKKYETPDSPWSVGWTSPHVVTLADEDNPLLLDCGEELAPISVEYEVYGEMNPRRDNVILLLHALSGDAHAAGWDKEAQDMGRSWRLSRPGWWDTMIGPGKALDTNIYCVICSNVLGSCYGTTGPVSIDPDTGKPYGLDFPIVTVGDWVRLQERLVSYLGIEKLYAVVGGSLGGQQALEWSLAYPDRVERAVILASSARLSSQGLAFNAVARNSILNDINFNGGDYYEGDQPAQGLAVARMLGHITYLSETSMRDKFGRRYRKNGDRPGFHLGVDFEVESYLEYQGQSFVSRFDANSYLYITRAMDYYDAADRGGGDLDKACKTAKARFLLISFSSDWLYTPEQMKELTFALYRTKKDVSYVEIPSTYGHDAFLLEVDRITPLISKFLKGVACHGV